MSPLPSDPTKELEQANQKVVTAVGAGIVSGVITTIVALFHLFGFDSWALIDAFIIFGLTFGIFKKNRACAIILLVYWVIDKISQMAAGGMTGGISGALGALPGLIIFGPLFFQGILGTFAYHKLAGGKR